MVRTLIVYHRGQLIGPKRQRLFQIMFHQTFAPHDLVIVAVLIGLEGVLSLDNALVLALLARRLPEKLRKRALFYGLIGAIGFRVGVVAMAALLLRWRWAKLVGGVYLIYVAAKHLFRRSEKFAAASGDRTSAIGESAKAFWTTVALIELTDIAFAVDSILAAIALVDNAPNGATVHPKLWVVIIGGVAGLILMRFAAILFIRLLERFPRFETSAYFLVLIIGTKMLIDWCMNLPTQAKRVDFDDIHSGAFCMFWGLVALSVAYGFLPRRKILDEKMV